MQYEPLLNYLSILFPPDPTLTVDNVSHIMEKVEPKERQQVWKNISSTIFKDIQSSEKYSTDMENEAAAIDMYIKCDPRASWKKIAKSLYHHHQVAAVAEMRSYLPPRGEPCCGVHVPNLNGICVEL